jgi:hypothetical protein
MLRRCSTTFITIGQPCSLISAATRSSGRRSWCCERKSFISRVESWNDSWMWSRPRFLQARGAFLGQADARGEQVGVEAQAVRFGRRDFQVVAQQRFAARQAQLHRAQRAPSRSTRSQSLGAQFVLVAREVQRVEAEHAMQRAAVGQLGQQPERRDRGGRRSSMLHSQPASVAPRSSMKANTSGSSPSWRRPAPDRSTISAARALPSQRLRISPRSD